VIGLWANNLPLFDDDKTRGVIYAWIKVKLHRLPLNSCITINNKIFNEVHETKQIYMHQQGERNM